MGMPAACEPKTRFHRRNGTQLVEKRGIGRNLKVEVEETVNQDASNAQSCRERRSAIHVVHPFADLLGRPAINDDEKPEHHDKSEPSHLHQQLQVVIMRGVYKKIGIEAAKLRIYIRNTPSPHPTIGLSVNIFNPSRVMSSRVPPDSSARAS